MKKILSILLISILIVGVFSGCTTKSSINDIKGNGNGNSYGKSNEIEASVTVSQNEAQGLVYMIQEEKLARDVYTFLYDKWGTQTFKSISASEQNHMDAVEKLLIAYEIDNPIDNLDIGVFENEELQDLYNNLIKIGSESEVEALKTGALIEEVDIVDLQKYISETNNEDIVRVYQNLIDGSENHLSAFVSQLSTFGIEYAPQYLPLDQYNAIVSSNSNSNGEKGNSGKNADSNSSGGQNGGNGGQNGGN